MNIRPVSDLRNRYADVEKDLKNSGAVYFTKNGYGTAVLVEISRYLEMTGQREMNDIKPMKTEPINHQRGFLHKYADPELVRFEKEAGRIHAKERYGK